MKQCDKSIPYYLKALSLDSTNRWTYNKLAGAYACSDKKDFDQAIAILKDAYKRFPDHHLYLINMSNLYYDAGKMPESYDYCEQAIAKIPSKVYPYLYVKMVRWYAEKSQLAKADIFYQILIQQHPTKFWHLATAAYLLDKQVAYNTYLQKSIETASTSSQYYAVGSVYAETNDLEKALPWFEKAFENGFDEIEQIKADSTIWEAPAFQELLKRYFPELLDK